jgi:hypothetical protein
MLDNGYIIVYEKELQSSCRDLNATLEHAKDGILNVIDWQDELK